MVPPPAAVDPRCERGEAALRDAAPAPPPPGVRLDGGGKDLDDAREVPSCEVPLRMGVASWGWAGE